MAGDEPSAKVSARATRSGKPACVGVPEVADATSHLCNGGDET